MLDIFDAVKIDTLDTRIINKLPMAFDEFKTILIDLNLEHHRKLLRELISENKENIFPRGNGAQKLFYKTPVSLFPQLIIRRPDGNWDTLAPEETFQSDLGNNGKVTVGLIKNTVFYKIHKPDNIPLKDFYSDPTTFMDFVLKSAVWPRPVGPENIRITSLGNADHASIHIDSYGRKWMVKTWPIPFGDQEVVMFSLPVPGGTLSLSRAGPTHLLPDHILDLQALTNFVWITMEGTLKSWQEYLEMKPFLPALFSDIDTTFHDGKFRYKSRRFEFSCESEGSS